MNNRGISFVRTPAAVLAFAAILCGCFSAPDHSNSYDPENNDVVPIVVSSTPGMDGIDGDINAEISATFNAYIDALSVTADSFIVYDRLGNRLMGRVSCDGKTVTFRPALPLFHSHTYRAVLTAVIQGTGGVNMREPHTWSFTTTALNIPEMVEVPENTFAMGTDRSGITIPGMPFIPYIRIPDGTNNLPFLTYTESMPIHDVHVSGFQVGKYEITFDEYDEFCDSTGRKKIEDYWGRGKRPVGGVNWFEAVEYCNWLSGVRGYDPCYVINGAEVSCDFAKNGYRLPTEAEWESAARGAGTTPGHGYSGFHEGDDYLDLALYSWCALNSNSATHEVGTKLPNDIGIYDMSGNVAEWCWDWYSTTYYQACHDAATVDNPAGPDLPVSGDYRKATRGGGYLVDLEFYLTAIRGNEGDDQFSWPHNKAAQLRTSVTVGSAGDLGFRVCRRPYAGE